VGYLHVVSARRGGCASPTQFLRELRPLLLCLLARALLRRAAAENPGSKRIVAHPAVISVIEQHPEWLDALCRQLGGNIGLRADANLTMSGGYAENV